MMRRFCGLLCLMMGVSLLCAASSSNWNRIPEKDHNRANPLAARADTATAGALVYHEHCAQCHRSDAMGDGRKKPSLHSERIKSATDGDLEWFLRQGDRAHGMPSWSNLPEAQRWQLVAYLRSIQ